MPKSNRIVPNTVHLITEDVPPRWGSCRVSDFSQGSTAFHPGLSSQRASGAELFGASDGAIASNMAIVPVNNGFIRRPSFRKHLIWSWTSPAISRPDANAVHTR